MAVPTYNKHVLHRNARIEYRRQLLLVGVTAVLLAVVAAVVFAFVNNRFPAAPAPSSSSATAAGPAAQAPSAAQAGGADTGQSGDPSAQGAQAGTSQDVPVIKEGA